MPFTPLHLATVWPAWVRWPKRLDFLALSMGCAADLEVIPMMLMGYEPRLSRGLMHSIFGAVTVDLLVAVLFAAVVGPWLIRTLKKRWWKDGWFRFNGTDVPQKHGLGVIVYSALIGTVSHVTLDLFNHPYNPFFYPLDHGNVDALFLFEGRLALGAISQASLALLMVWMAYRWYLKEAMDENRG